MILLVSYLIFVSLN